MAEAINCNYGRTAIRAIAQTLYVQKGCVKKFPPKAMTQLMQEYQLIFKDTPSMTLSTTASTVVKLLATFNSHWHLQEKKNDFLKTFSIAEWKKLTAVQQAGHTIKQCHTCQTQYQVLQHFLTNKPVRRKLTSPLHLMTSHHLLQLDGQSLVSWIRSHTSTLDKVQSKSSQRLLN